MEKYKLCPFCGKRNLPKMLECVQCETDLSTVPVTDENMEQKKNDHKELKTTIQMVRICGCGAHNPVNVRKCEKCGEDISDIVPSPEVLQEDEKIHYALASVEGNYVHEMMSEREIIGRENVMKEYLENKPYVSRKHAELYIEEDDLYIVNLSQTNYTYINNIKVVNGPYKLLNGDEVGLGGNEKNGIRQEEAAYFQVRIGTCI